MSNDLRDRQRHLELIAHLLVADFQVTDEEYAFLNETAARLSLSADDLKEVMGRVNLGADVTPIAEAVPQHMRAMLIEDLEQAAVCDGELAAREQALLRKITRVLRGSGGLS
ncbi:MAG: TerB family tellurite resistance protein [Myxococcales bacterium]|nr:TerB family tellurite resistance protein [Myxococcales bacterium]